MKKYIPAILIIVVGVFLWAVTRKQKEDVPQPTHTQLGFTLPSGYRITPAYTGLKRIRFMAWSPDHRLFLTDMKDLSDNHEGTIYILEHFDESSGAFTTIHTYLDHLHNPNSVAFYKDRTGQEWLYVALTDKLIRYPYSNGDMKPSGEAQTLATFPAYGLSYKYGGWHLTRTIAINDDEVYVSIGSSCNSCEERSDEPRAQILAMHPDGSGQHVVAHGLRNAVGIKFFGDDLVATAMGADHLGPDKPEEAVYKIKEGTDYGWPYCYQFQGHTYADTSQGWKHPIDCSTVPLAFATFPAHSAPLGLEDFGDYFLVALHGSSTVSLAHGYKIVKVHDDGRVEDFITGLLRDGVRSARPVDILRVPNSDSFFFTDDFGGTLYYVKK